MKLFILQFIQVLRTPITFFWTICLPTILNFAFSYNEKQTIFQIGYIIISVYLYGGIFPIISQREMGFFKCIAYTKKSIYRYFFVSYTVNFLVVFLSVFIYLSFSYVLSNVSYSAFDIIKLLIFLPIISLISFVCLFSIILIKIRISDLITLSNILIFLFLYLSYLDFRDSLINVNILNIIYDVNGLLYFIIFNEVTHMSGLCLILLFPIGLYSALKFSKQPFEVR